MAATLARGVTWWESRACPVPWRGTWATGTPSSVPSVTVAVPWAVVTSSARGSSRPSSSYSPVPVMRPIGADTEWSLPAGRAPPTACG